MRGIGKLIPMLIAIIFLCQNVGFCIDFTLRVPIGGAIEIIEEELDDDGKQIEGVPIAEIREDTEIILARGIYVDEKGTYAPEEVAYPRSRRKIKFKNNDEFVVFISLYAMQHSRFILEDIDKECLKKETVMDRDEVYRNMASLDGKYSQMGYKEYRQALQSLIEKYGIKTFTDAVKIVFDIQLNYRLDLNYLDLESLEIKKDSLAELTGHYHLPHSDIPLFNDWSTALSKIPVLVSSAISYVHKTPQQYVFFIVLTNNTRTLFYDIDFWKTIEEYGPEIFFELKMHLFTILAEWEKVYARQYRDSDSFELKEITKKMTGEDVMRICELYFPEAYAILTRDEETFIKFLEDKIPSKSVQTNS